MQPEADKPSTSTRLDLQTFERWLKSDITLTVPGWVLAAAAVLVVVLTGVALD